MFLHQQGPGVDYCGKPLPVRSVGGRWHPFGEIERTRHRIGDLQVRGARAQEEIAKLKKAYRELDDRSRLTEAHSYPVGPRFYYCALEVRPV